MIKKKNWKIDIFCQTRFKTAKSLFVLRNSFFEKFTLTITYHKKLLSLEKTPREMQLSI